MIKAWNRYSAIITDKYKLDMQDIDFDFTITKKEMDKPMDADIVIYNLNKEVRDSISPSTPIVVYAGYEENYGIIFEGLVGVCYTNKIGEDIKTTIIATEDTVKWNISQVHSSWSRGITADFVVRDAIKKAGFKEGFINIPKTQSSQDFKFEKGLAFRGDLRQLLKDIAEDTGCEYNINGSMVDFYGKNSTDGQRIITISPANGLINAHERVDAESSKQSKASSSSDPYDQEIEVGKIAPNENVPIDQMKRVNEQYSMQTGKLPYATKIDGSVDLQKYKQSWDLELMLNHEYKVGYGIKVINSDWIGDSIFKIKEYTHVFRGDNYQTNMKVEEVIQ